ncbi:MAG: ABC transporter ATP-binding protein [Raoultibacter sp.]
MNNLLKIEGLSKHYDGFDLVDVDLEIPAGMVVGLVGSNGAGKTTIIKSLLGLIKPDAGTVNIFGERIFDATNKGFDDAKLSALKENIGVVFDTCAFPSETRVKDVGFMMKNAYKSWDEESFQSYLHKFGLSPKKGIKELSRGMGMNLSLACALSHGAQLLILDEATAGLDPLARDEVLELFQQFMADEKHAILMSSHITSDLEKIADFIVCIDNGRIIFSVEKDVITDSAGIAQCRTTDLERIVADGYFASGELRILRREFGTMILVPDRFEFQQAYRDIAVERASIDEYMSLLLKGEQR